MDGGQLLLFPQTGGSRSVLFRKIRCFPTAKIVLCPSRCGSIRSAIPSDFALSLSYESQWLRRRCDSAAGIHDSYSVFHSGCRDPWSMEFGGSQLPAEQAFQAGITAGRSRAVRAALPLAGMIVRATVDVVDFS